MNSSLNFYLKDVFKLDNFDNESGKDYSGVVGVKMNDTLCVGDKLDVVSGENKITANIIKIKKEGDDTFIESDSKDVSMLTLILDVNAEIIKNSDIIVKHNEGVFLDTVKMLYCSKNKLFNLTKNIKNGNEYLFNYNNKIIKGNVINCIEDKTNKYLGIEVKFNKSIFLVDGYSLTVFNSKMKMIGACIAIIS